MAEVLTDVTGRQHLKPTVAVRQSCPFDWTSVFNFLGTLPNPDNITPSVYRRMAETDCTIAAVLQFIELTVASGMGTYKHPQKRGQRFIETMWEHCETPFHQAVSEGLRGSLTYGVKFQEIVLRPGEGKIWLDELPGLKPEDLELEVDSVKGSATYGRLTGVRQRQALEARIDRSSLVVSVNQPEDSNHWGRSQLKSIYADWVISTALKVGWGDAQQTYGSPPTIAYLKGGNNPEQGEDGSDSTRQKNMLAVLKKLRAGSCVTADIEDRIEMLATKFPVGEDHERAQNHFAKNKMRGLLMPSLLFEPTEIGSLALGNKHWELFRAFANHLVLLRSQVLLRQLYRPVLWLNFGPRFPVGEFLVQRREEEDQKLLSEIFFALTQVGYLNPRQLDDYNAVRAKFDLPPAAELPPPPPVLKGQSQGSVGGSIADNGRPSGEVAPGTEGTNTGAPRATGRTPAGPQGRASGGPATAAVVATLDKHSYASTQVDIEEPLRQQLIDWAGANLEPADVEEYETAPHVTIRYGLVEPDLVTVQAVIGNEPEGTMILGGLSLFCHPGRPDVLKLDVHSADLARLNRRLQQLHNVETYPVYQPHLTLAYLREGAGAKYVGSAWSLPIFCSGREIRFSAISLCDTEGNKSPIRLGGSLAEAV